MKEHDLSLSMVCGRCNKSVVHTGVPLFWRVKVERFGIDLQAVKRQQGLGMFLGSHALASVMGPDEDLAKPVMETVEISLCEDCAMNMTVVMAAENGNC